MSLSHSSAGTSSVCAQDNRQQPSHRSFSSVNAVILLTIWLRRFGERGRREGEGDGGTGAHPDLGLAPGGQLAKPLDHILIVAHSRLTQRLRRASRHQRRLMRDALLQERWDDSVAATAEGVHGGTHGRLLCGVAEGLQQRQVRTGVP